MWQTFETETGIKAKAFINNGFCEKVKMISSVPRGYYYSCLNEVLETAEKLFTFKN